MIVAYVIYGTETGSIRRCGRVGTADLLAHIRLAGDESIAEISHEAFAPIWNEQRHYFRYDSVAAAPVRKTPMQIVSDRYTLPADGKSIATISTATPVSEIELLVNGFPQVVKGGRASLAHNAPCDLAIEISPNDPAYYTERHARATSAAGKGNPFGPLIINVEAVNGG